MSGSRSVAALRDLDDSGQDVIVDAGRLGLVGSPTPLLDAADVTLLVTRATLPSISAARSWAETVRQPATGWRHPGLLLVGEGQPYRASEVAKVLGMPVVADLPDDPAAAAVYHRGAAPPKHFETGPYVRGLQAAVAVHPGARRSRSVRAGRGGAGMTEAYRFANEYGDLTRLPLFSQTDQRRHAGSRAISTPTVASPPAATSDVDWAVGLDAACSGVGATEPGRRSRTAAVSTRRRSRNSAGRSCWT